MAENTHIPLNPQLRPQLVFPTRATKNAHELSPCALRLMYGVYWEPELGRKTWENLYSLSIARSLGVAYLVKSAVCVTHTSAALILGLSMWTREPDMYVAVRNHPKKIGTDLPRFSFPTGDFPQAVTHPSPYDRKVKLWRRQLEIDPSEIVVVEQTPVTTILRTAFDCAFDEPPHNALVIADSALRLYCQPDRRRPELAEQKHAEAKALWAQMLAKSSKRPGVGTAKTVLEVASPWAESPAESFTRWLVLALGLPAPELQHSIGTEQGPKFPDLCWPEFQVILEVDGQVKYTGGQVLMDEKFREETLQRQGWKFIRVTTAELRHLERVADKIMNGLPTQARKGRHARKELWGQWRGPAYRLPTRSRVASRLHRTHSTQSAA